jgi:hypothetical protein
MAVTPIGSRTGRIRPFWRNGTWCNIAQSNGPKGDGRAPQPARRDLLGPSPSFDGSNPLRAAEHIEIALGHCELFRLILTTLMFAVSSCRREYSFARDRISGEHLV